MHTVEGVSVTFGQTFSLVSIVVDICRKRESDRYKVQFQSSLWDGFTKCEMYIEDSRAAHILLKKLFIH